MGVATTIWKRTTPFSTHCQFVLNVDNENNKIDVCEEEAEFGVYMGIQTPNNSDGFDVTTLSVSFCLYHTIYQESIWIGGKE